MFGIICQELLKCSSLHYADKQHDLRPIAQNVLNSGQFNFNFTAVIGHGKHIKVVEKVMEGHEILKVQKSTNPD